MLYLSKMSFFLLSQLLISFLDTLKVIFISTAVIIQNHYVLVTILLL